MELGPGGKRALVTGRSKGIGRGSVELLAEEGCERLVRHRAEADFGNGDRWMDLRRFIPYARPATPAEIANAAAFLASPRSAYTNGTILTINGGP